MKLFKTILLTTSIIPITALAFINGTEVQSLEQESVGYLSAGNNDLIPAQVDVNYSLADPKVRIAEFEYFFNANPTDTISSNFGLGNIVEGDAIAINVTVLPDTGSGVTYEYDYIINKNGSNEILYSSPEIPVGGVQNLRFGIAVNESTGGYTFKNNFDPNTYTESDGSLGVFDDNTKLFSLAEAGENTDNSGFTVQIYQYNTSSEWLIDWSEFSEQANFCGENVEQPCVIDMSGDISSIVPPAIDIFTFVTPQDAFLGFNMDGDNSNYFALSAEGIEHYSANTSVAKVDCQATLISPTHAVTNAECIDNLNSPSDYTLSLGSTNKLDGEKYKISSITIHPNYIDTPEPENNIAIIELNTAPIVSPVKIFNYDNINDIIGNTTNNILSAYSWGDDSNGEVFNLNKIVLGYNNNCTANYPNLQPDQICLEDVEENIKTTCDYDEGAPVFYNNTLFSLFSHKLNPCTVIETEAIFTQLTEQLIFLENNIVDFHNLNISATDASTNTNMITQIDLTNNSELNSINNVGLIVTTSEEDLLVTDNSSQLTCTQIDDFNHECLSTTTLNPSDTLSGVIIDVSGFEDNVVYYDAVITTYADGYNYGDKGSFTNQIFYSTTPLLNLTEIGNNPIYIDEEEESVNTLNFNVENITQINAVNTLISIYLPTNVKIKNTSLSNCNGVYPIVCELGTVNRLNSSTFTLTISSSNPNGIITIESHSDYSVQKLGINNPKITLKTEDYLLSNPYIENGNRGVDSKSGGSIGYLFSLIIPLLLIRKKNK